VPGPRHTVEVDVLEAGTGHSRPAVSVVVEQDTSDGTAPIALGVSFSLLAVMPARLVLLCGNGGTVAR
jgi:hypothetical protein